MSNAKKVNKGKFKPKDNKSRPPPKRKTKNNKNKMPNDSKSGVMVVAPTAMSQTRRTAPPKFTPLPNGDVIITMREYINDIISGTGTPSTFGGTFFAINPGLQTMFPWLSRIAGNYESYYFTKLAFVYETEASTSTTGTVILAVDYDAADSAPTTKQQAMTYRGSVRCSPWNGCRHVSLTEDIKKYKMYTVRTTGQIFPATYDIKTYDTGNLFALTQGCPPTTILGELYVEYTVRLITPGSVLGSQIVQGGQIVSGGGGTSAANPYGLAPTPDPQNFGIAMNNASVITVSYPGYFLVGIRLDGTVITNVAIAGSAGVVVVQLENTINGAGTSCNFVYKIQTTAANSTLSITATATTIVDGYVQMATAPLFSLT